MFVCGRESERAREAQPLPFVHVFLAKQIKPPYVVPIPSLSISDLPDPSILSDPTPAARAGHRPPPPRADDKNADADADPDDDDDATAKAAAAAHGDDDDDGEPAGHG